MYARVALPAALPQALTYLIPEPFRSVAAPGCRARVRLRNQTKVGMILAITPEPGCPVETVRPLEEVLDAEPLLPPHILGLIAFASEYYLSPPGLVARLAVPSGALALPPPLLEAGERAREALVEVEGREAELLERLLETRRITLTRLCAEGWRRRELDEVVARLVERHGVRVVERGAPRAGVATVTAVSLAELDPPDREARLGKAPAQVRIVRYLEELGRPVLEGELLAACECSAAVVAALSRKGLVRRFQQARQTTLRRWELAPPPRPAVLSPHQQAAVERVASVLGTQAFHAFLLLGVTGSGKTEVYLRLAGLALERSLQTVILVPEIGLTPALAGQLYARFGERAVVLHSSMAEGERFAAWERARRGQADVVLGPRSALWAPLPRPGLVVVDEEQDGSYKQGEEPRYNARDLALVLGQQLGIPVVLASATPSLEAMALAAQGRLEVLELPERVAGGQLPTVEVVDLRQEAPEPGEHGQRFLSRRARELLGDRLERGEQAILLVNRRGWAPVLLCRECGFEAACTACSIPLTVHRRKGGLLCHYCGQAAPVPTRCPRCGGEVLDDVGAGTEKIESLVSRVFPSARVGVLDRDTARSPAQLVATLEGFAAGSTDVLVGTQMVSKGHHFPRVTLTVVVNADNLLGFPDFRGAERTFQMLTQVAGRAGRGERAGEVLIQTYHPDHHAVRAAVSHDVKTFAANELTYRSAFRYPPAARMALVRFESLSEQAAEDAARAAAAAVEPAPRGLRVVGPAPAPLVRLREKWRYQILFLAATRAPLRRTLGAVAALSLPASVHRVIDVDPLSTV